MKALYEATPRQKQLAAFGRKMMDFSENASMAKLKDAEIRPYNDLSEVGFMLTQVGETTEVRDFSEHHQQVIKNFAKYGGSNLVKGGPCLRTTF
jgi:hypothetical protein